jgi:NADH-quinone oxidoreductase subunit E
MIGCAECLLHMHRWDHAGMLPEDLRQKLYERIAAAEHPRELAVDIIFALQERCGYVSDELLQEAAELLGMTPLELEEIATFYEFIYREPVGKYVIHVCDGVVCWMQNHQSVLHEVSARLGIQLGETTPDGLFTLLPACCIGYCDRAPAMMINRKVYGELTPERIDYLLQELRNQAPAGQGIETYVSTGPLSES